MAPDTLADALAGARTLPRPRRSGRHGCRRTGRPPRPVAATSGTHRTLTGRHRPHRTTPAAGALGAPAARRPGRGLAAGRRPHDRPPRRRGRTRGPHLPAGAPAPPVPHGRPARRGARPVVPTPSTAAARRRAPRGSDRAPGPAPLAAPARPAPLLVLLRARPPPAPRRRPPPGPRHRRPGPAGRPGRHAAADPGTDAPSSRRLAAHGTAPGTARCPTRCAGPAARRALAAAGRAHHGHGVHPHRHRAGLHPLGARHPGRPAEPGPDRAGAVPHAVRHGPGAQAGQRRRAAADLHGQITQAQAFDRGIEPFRGFMLKQVRDQDLQLFVDLSGKGKPATPKDVPTTTLDPGVHHLRAADGVPHRLHRLRAVRRHRPGGQRRPVGDGHGDAAAER